MNKIIKFENKCSAAGCGRVFISDFQDDFCPTCRDRFTIPPIQLLQPGDPRIPGQVLVDALQEDRKHNHYFKDVSRLETIDVYRVLDLFDVVDPCLQHIVKKALCAGRRGAKDFEKDCTEIRDTIERKIEMLAEDGRHVA